MPRKAKPIELYREVPTYAIERMGRLAGVKKRLDVLHGPGAWGKDEVVDYILAKRKAEDEEKALLTQAEQEVLSAEAARAQAIGKRRAGYLRSLTDVTPGDHVMIDQMCEIEQQLEELGPGGKDESGAALKARSQMRIALIGEHRKIQNDLGIGRSTRVGEIDQAVVVREFVEGARRLMDAKGIRIDCPHCKETSRINQGFIVFHFAAHVPYRWVSRCANPKCGAEIVIQGGPADA